VTDPMRDQINRLDPMPPTVPTIADSGEDARQLVERIMATPIDQNSQPQAPTPRRRSWTARPTLIAAGLVTVVAIAAVAGFGRLTAPTTPTPVAAVELALPDGLASGSCMVFDAALLADVPVAFAGTVTGIANGVVELRVDRWYRGGTASVVRLEAPSPDSVALDGLALEMGGRYLVSATNDTANGCGLSGPATPELQAAFDQAFGG
jgi:hypothetical protein